MAMARQWYDDSDITYVFWISECQVPGLNHSGKKTVE